jgi:hypothetical protein
MRAKGRAASALGHALVLLGSLCLVAGVVAGYVNRTVLDSDRLAASIDEVRRDPAVSAVLGRALTDALLRQQPDAVAVRPLIDSVATSLVGSNLLSGPTRAAAGSFTRALTEPSSGTVVLRVADAGAVVTAALQRIAPPGTISADTTVPLELARIGDQSFADRTLRLARFVRAAAWVLPLAGVLLVVVGVLLAPRRRPAVLVAGVALLGLTGLLAMLLLLGALWSGSQDDGTLRGALIRHGWPVVVGPIWWSVLGIGAVGLLLTASAAALVPDVDPAAVLRRGRALAAGRPGSETGQVVRAAVLIVAGAAVVVRPGLVLAAAGVLAGIWLVLYGVHELGAATGADVPARGPGATPGRSGLRVGVPLGASALVALVLLATWGALPPVAASAASSGVVTGRGEICNGHAELCDRRCPDVAYAASHNSMATATDPTWFIPEQGHSITGQLDDGVRALLIDVWPGYPTTQNRVATARSAYAEAKAQLERELGPEVVAAGLRVVDAVSDPTPAGPETLYLCHGLCEIGATAFQPEMASVRAWLDTHPDEILTVVIEDYVDAGRIGAALEASGLASYAAAPPDAGAPWPTLREMITSGKRLYVLLENGTRTDRYPWLANAYQRLLQETPYTAPTPADLATCKPNRGRADAPLLLMNHWLTGFDQLVSNARRANAAAVLGTRAELCRTERRLPTFVAVNYTDLGDLRAVVRKLNGVP